MGQQTELPEAKRAGKNCCFIMYLKKKVCSALCMPVLKIATREIRSTELYIPFPHQNQTYNKSFFPHFTKLYNNLDPKIRRLADFF